MKKIIFIISFLFVRYGFSQTILNDPHWEIVWEDNFNSFDANKWFKGKYMIHGDEPQLYLENMVSTNAGNLVLKMTNTQTQCPSNSPGWSGGTPCIPNKWYNYTAGWVNSKQEYNFKYGLVQARIKLPYGRGFWPAFWTFVGHGQPFVNYAEIDIFEMLGHLPSDLIGTNIHRGYSSSEPNYGQDIIMSSTYANVYHNYAIAWSPTKIVWYVDGIPIRITNNHGIVDFVELVFNFAITPSYPPNSFTPFPSEMLIDYVKVSKLKNDCSTNINSCNFNFGIYDNKVKQNIIIGGTGCTNNIPNSQNIYLRASESFKIKSKFTVPIGSSFFVDVNPCH